MSRNHNSQREPLLCLTLSTMERMQACACHFSSTGLLCCNMGFIHGMLQSCSHENSVALRTVDKGLLSFYHLMLYLQPHELKHRGINTIYRRSTDVSCHQTVRRVQMRLVLPAAPLYDSGNGEVYFLGSHVGWHAACVLPPYKLLSYHQLNSLTVCSTYYHMNSIMGSFICWE